MLTTLLLAAGAAALVAAAARGRRALTPDGAAAATVVGTLAVAGAGWWGGVVLVLFFATSSVLSRLPKRSRTAEVAARGAERDAVQVAANGGVAALLAAATLVLPAALHPAFLAGYAGAIAAATADTWATEIGSRYGRTPRMITTGRPVAPGTSGGVTAVGTLAAAAGSLVIAAAAGLGASRGWTPATNGVMAAVALAGVAGSLADSLLGATVQAAYRCPRCGQATERRVHACGAPTERERGIPWVDNDVVNLAATTTGAVVALLLGRVLA